MKKLIIMALVLISFNSLAGAVVQYLTVGDETDLSCDYHSIQAAIDSGLSDTIRIASNKVYFENVVINDKDMVLTGGYVDCTNASNNITDLSSAVIDGGGSGSVVLVSGNNQERNVDIRHLLIGNGTSGLMTTADVQLNVNDVTLVNNDNVGAFIFGGENSVTFEDVVVTSNDGPGVICSGTNNFIKFEGDSLITGNDSSTNGGGLSISGECRANLYAPTKVINNTSVDDGGGIYVSSGSEVNLVGVEISGNTADIDSTGTGSGGAVAVFDALSVVNAANSKFISNSAKTGGAIAAFNEGEFLSYAVNTVSAPCNTPGNCTEYRGNAGDVFSASHGGKIDVLHANIKNNASSLSQGGVVAFTFDGGAVNIEGSMIVKNGTDSFPGLHLFYINGTGIITLNHVTVADNEISQSVVYNDAGTFALNASIVQESVDISMTDSPVSHTFECAIVHETDSFSAGGTVTIDDPQFINPGLDYHIKPTSPAIDYCYAAVPLSPGLGYDMEFEGRNYDDPNVTNLHGAYDIGADEYRWDNDLIFMHGFEQD